MFQTIRKYPEARVMKPGVNESAHLLQAVKEFVGHLDGGKKRMSLTRISNVMSSKGLHNLEQYCLSSHHLPSDTPTLFVSPSELLSIT